ncbi:MAG: diacylglycerol/lipid kinase family protein [Candidatus Brachytrichaceae bacterium NZ_4S206]|jgi:diacylglycerol kinase family enzyme
MTGLACDEPIYCTRGINLTSNVVIESTAHLREVKRALAVINPRSGDQSGSLVAGWLNEIADERDIELIIRETEPESSARDLVQDAAAFDRVIVSGGDGTIMQVINGLVRRNIPLAIIPAGTGNALAMALHLTPDLRRACEEALDVAALMPLDLGLLNGELYFALRLSVGYEARVTQDATRELKTRFGKMAYAWQAIRHAMHLDAVRYRFEVDSRVLRRRAESVWVANAGSLGVFDFSLDPGIAFDDSRLDLCVMRFTLSHDFRVILHRLVSHQRLPASVLSHVPVRQYVRIIAYPRQPVQVDGEVIEATTPCEVRVAPKAIQLCRAASGLSNGRQA